MRSVPLLGWAYVLAGLVVALLGRAPAGGLLRASWWVVAVLSTVGHAAQIPSALAADRLAGRPRLETVAMTQLFGVTWRWTQPETEER
ncbi:hypothetical protein IU452_25040 [Nocardia transvalensis]|nr:hypothetical protein [Nocardia transvalensis]